MSQEAELLLVSLQNQASPELIKRRDATNFLLSYKMTSNGVGHLYNIITNNQINTNIKLAAATYLKNYVKDYFYGNSDKSFKDSGKVLTNEIKEFILKNSLKLLLSTERSVVPSVCEMINEIVKGAQGYLIIWPNLMKEISNILVNHQLKNNSILYILISRLTARYHLELKSEPLFEEIIATLGEICEPMTKDLEIELPEIVKNLNNINNITEDSIQRLTLTYHCLKIFFNLNYQDFPEYFEDNLKRWISILTNILYLPIVDNETNQLLKKAKELTLKIKIKVLKCLNFYYQQYYEDIEQVIGCVNDGIWKITKDALNTNNRNDPKIIKQLLQFYSFSFRSDKFNVIKDINVEIAKELYNKLIYSNLSFSEDDYIKYEENPNDFIKIEFEEADLNSNKFYASELLKKLIIKFPEMLNVIINEISNNLNKFNSNKFNNWQNKIIAMNLTYIILIENYSQTLGVTKVKNGVNISITDLINEFYIKEFQNNNFNNGSNENNGIQIEQILSIKFLSVFRQQVNPEFLPSIFENLTGVINSTSFPSVQQAALLCIDSIINMQNLENRSFVSQNCINDNKIFTALLGMFVNFINKDVNSFAMKCFYRTIKLTNPLKVRENISSLGQCINSFMDKIEFTIQQKNTNAEFNYYFFETWAIILKKLSDQSLNNLNNGQPNVNIIKEFYQIVQGHISKLFNGEFMEIFGYGLQIHSMVLFLIKELYPFDQQFIQSLIGNMNFWKIEYKQIFAPALQYIKVNLILNTGFASNQALIDQLFSIVFEIFKLKCTKEVFDFMNDLINVVNISLLGGNLVKMFQFANQEIQNNQSQNPSYSIELRQHILLFISKMYFKLGDGATLNFLKSCENNVEDFFLNMEKVILLYRKINNKSLTFCFYLKVLENHCKDFNQPFLINLAFRLFEDARDFYGLKICNFASSSNENNLLGQQGTEDLSYNNVFNILVNVVTENNSNNYLSFIKNFKETEYFKVMKKIQNDLGNDILCYIIKNKYKGRPLEKAKNYCKLNGYYFQ